MGAVSSIVLINGDSINPVLESKAWQYNVFERQARGHCCPFERNEVTKGSIVTHYQHR